MYPASFKQLQALMLVARHQSVSRAAEAMHVTQPAVSLHLKLLEEAAGVPLTRRQGRNIQMTAAGELLVGYAERILGLWEEAGDEIAALKGVTSGTLRIGAVMTAEHLLPPMLVRFTTGRPHVRIKLQVGSRPEVIGMLSRDEIDLAIMGTPPREFPTSASRFARHPMAFFVAPAIRCCTERPSRWPTSRPTTCSCANLGRARAPRSNAGSRKRAWRSRSAPSCPATRRSSR